MTKVGDDVEWYYTRFTSDKKRTNEYTCMMLAKNRRNNMVLVSLERKIYFQAIRMFSDISENEVTHIRIFPIPRLACKICLMFIVSISNRICFFVFSAKQLLFFFIIQFCIFKSLKMRRRQFREEGNIWFCNIYLYIHLPSMIDAVLEDQHARIARIHNGPTCRQKHMNPCEEIFVSTADTEDCKSKSPLPIVVSFWRPDITTSTMQNLKNNMTSCRLSKRSSNTDNKRFVTKNTKSSQETENFLNQFFHEKIIENSWNYPVRD